MVTAMIGGPALAALLGWNDEADRLPPALWLPASAEDEPLLLSALSEAWSGEDWYGLGTWFAPPAAPNPPAGLADRYDGLSGHVVAESRSTTPRGLRVRSDWSTLAAQAGTFPDFFTATRRSSGKGSAIALLPAARPSGAWYAASTALVHRALLAVETPGDVDIVGAHHAAVVSYLAATRTAGFAAVVPLDLHPWGGCVVVADEGHLTALTASLPDVVPGLADLSWETVVAQAGGLAL